MPHLLDCARAHASEGEIVEALQDVWGTYTETPSSEVGLGRGPIRGPMEGNSAQLRATQAALDR